MECLLVPLPRFTRRLQILKMFHTEFLMSVAKYRTTLLSHRKDHVATELLYTLFQNQSFKYMKLNVLLKC